MAIIKFDHKDVEMRTNEFWLGKSDECIDIVINELDLRYLPREAIHQAETVKVIEEGRPSYYIKNRYGQSYRSCFWNMEVL